MLKNKSIDYIFGMITGASLMVAFWACKIANLRKRRSKWVSRIQTWDGIQQNTKEIPPLGASGSTVQEVKVVNESWNPVNVSVIE